MRRRATIEAQQAVRKREEGAEPALRQALIDLAAASETAAAELTK